MLKFGKKELKRIFGIALSVMMAVSCFAGLSLTAEAVSATDSHVVYADDFEDATTLSNWRWLSNETSKPQYTASIADGSMTFNNVDGSGSFLHSTRFIADKYFTNQRVAITFKGQKGIKPTLWARLSQPYKGNSGEVYGYYLMFNCNQNGNVTLDLSKRVKASSPSIGSVSYGGNTIVEGQEYTLEMVCQGTNPTLISVSLYTKFGSVENAVVCHDTFLDSEASLQVASSAGVGGARTSAVTQTNVVIDSFEFTSTDKVTGNYYVEDVVVEKQYKTFGQVVNLDPTKKYILSATVKDNGTNSGGELVNPLWIEYFNTNSEGQNLLTSRGSLSSNRTEESVGTSGIEYDEYYKVFYEFDMSTLTDNKVEEGLGGKTRVIVGVRNDASTATTGKFTNIKLYAKDDANKTNLLINPDFKMGMYGWNDQAGSHMNYAQMTEGSSTATYATLSESVNDYEFYNIFKNTGYKVTQGDATRDTMVDVKDLVRTKKIASGTDRYYVAVDYDENGAVNASDLTFLRKQILGIAIDEGTQVNVSASDILSGKASEYDDSIGSGYTADYK